MTNPNGRIFYFPSFISNNTNMLPHCVYNSHFYIQYHFLHSILCQYKLILVSINISWDSERAIQKKNSKCSSRFIPMCSTAWSVNVFLPLEDAIMRSFLTRWHKCTMSVYRCMIMHSNWHTKHKITIFTDNKKGQCIYYTLQMQ